MPQFDSPTASPDRVHPFRLTEQRIWPGCIEIEVEGELDFVVSDQLRTMLNDAQAGPCHVLLDFGGCSFIDSSGLAVLIAAGRSFAARDRQVLLYGVHGQVRRMVSVTGLAEHGLAISWGDAAASPPLAAALPSRSFEVAVAGGESVWLTMPATAAA